MERNFRLFTSWIEETLQVGVVEENKVLQWKQAQKPADEAADPVRTEHAKAS